MGVAPVAPLLAYELAGAGQRTVLVGIAQTTAHCVRVAVSLALTSTLAASHPATSLFALAAVQGAVMVIAGRPGGGVEARPGGSCAAVNHGPVHWATATYRALMQQ